MTRYIVSTELTGGLVGYNHKAVKLAYKAGAVIEYADNILGWDKVVKQGPAWFPDQKYRALITPDMPQEIQDLVNWREGEDLPPLNFPVHTRQAAPTRHKHADVIIAWANGEVIQTKKSNGNWEDWHCLREGTPLFGLSDHEYRIAPRTIKIGDIEVPAPEIQPPAIETVYYCPDPLEMQHMYTKWYWNNDEQDRHNLASNLVHLDPQTAQDHTLAIIKLIGGQHPDNYEVAK